MSRWRHSFFIFWLHIKIFWPPPTYTNYDPWQLGLYNSPVVKDHLHDSGYHIITHKHTFKISPLSFISTTLSPWELHQVAMCCSCHNDGKIVLLTSSTADESQCGRAGPGVCLCGNRRLTSTKAEQGHRCEWERRLSGGWFTTWTSGVLFTLILCLFGIKVKRSVQGQHLCHITDGAPLLYNTTSDVTLCLLLSSHRARHSDRFWWIVTMATSTEAADAGTAWHLPMAPSVRLGLAETSQVGHRSSWSFRAGSRSLQLMKSLAPRAISVV